MSRITNLLTKYRPDCWDDLLGNSSLRREVDAMFASGLTPNGFLITGDYGCGKTSVARLIARTIACEARGESLSLCGNCPGCSIDLSPECRGLFEGVYSVNCSNLTLPQLDGMLNDARFAYPYLIYFLDEAHRARERIQDRLVTFLEAPECNFTVIICTPNENDIEAALLQRLHHLEVERPPIESTSQYLRMICTEEGFSDISQELLEELVRGAGGVPRQAVGALRHALFKGIKTPSDLRGMRRT